MTALTPQLKLPEGETVLWLFPLPSGEIYLHTQRNEEILEMWRSGGVKDETLLFRGKKNDKKRNSK